MPGAYAAIGAPIASKDTAEQVVTAPVLVPGSPDRERHRYSRENIAQVAKSFLPGGQVDSQHFGSDVARPTESYVLNEATEIGGREVPAGSWIVSAKVTDDAVWRQIEAGEITGMSVQAPVAAVYHDGRELSRDEWAIRIENAARMAARRPPDAAPAAAASVTDGERGAPAAKSPGLAAQGIQWTIAPAPVGEVWDVEFDEAQFVSLVGDPAVPEARFVVAKSASAGGGGPGTQSSAGQEDDIIMNDELEERLDSIAESVDESAQAAKAAAESADEAQEAAAEAQAASEDPGDGGGSGESNGEDYTAADLKGELEAEGVLGDSGGSGEENGGSEGDDGSEGAVNETLRTLVEAGVVDAEDLDDEDLDLDFDADEVSDVSPELEKRLATIEKAVQNPGRRGRASQLDALGSDDEDGDGSVSGERDFASALTAEGDD